MSWKMDYRKQSSVRLKLPPFRDGSAHTLRHSFATHMLEHGINMRTLQELMGHADVKTTEIHTHVMRRDLKRLTSPLDRIMEDHATQ